MSSERPRFWDANLQANLIAGLLAITPFVVVWVVFDFFLNALSAAGQPLALGLTDFIDHNYPSAAPFFASITVRWLIAVVVALLTLYSIGAVVSRVAGQRLFALFERLIARIPMVETIYSAAKRLIDVLRQPPGGGQRVVLIDFPQAGMKTLGFVMRVFKDAKTGEDIAAVYVPTALNPTCGYLQITPLANLTPTDLPPEQAMTMIISGGAVAPDRFTISG
jgi:uncharacterized membrane protein